MSQSDVLFWWPHSLGGKKDWHLMRPCSIPAYICPTSPTPFKTAISSHTGPYTMIRKRQVAGAAESDDAQTPGNHKQLHTLAKRPWPKSPMHDQRTGKFRVWCNA